MNWLKFFIFMCRGCIALFLLLLYSQFIFGQGFKVEEFKILPFDVTASIQMRSDSLNTPCGLVKVLTDDLYVKFVGNVVGSVQNKTNEYWVYLSKGTKELTIMRNQYLPLIVKFGDYEINEVESKVVYQLRLKDVSYNSTKNSLIINLKPKTSLLEIDNIEIERNQDGYYMFLLEKGEHVCRISNKNYLSKIEVVNIGKGTTLLDVKLESLMAEVKIECKTTDAHLFLNNKEIGIGTWEGELPAGSYTIVAKKVGHNPQTLEISIEYRN